MKILISIITTRKYRESRLKYILDTWYKDVEDIIIVTDEESSELPMIKFCDDDSYETNVPKNFFAINHFNEKNDNFDWYMILDDDTFLNYANLKKLLEKQDRESIFMLGHTNKGSFPQDPTLNYSSGGAGYVFNNKTMKVLSKINYNYGISRFADVNVGFYCRDNDIKIVHNDLFHPLPPESFNANDEYIKNAISFHYIIGEKQLELYNKIK
jgi:hypothetical protein